MALGVIGSQGMSGGGGGKGEKGLITRTNEVYLEWGIGEWMDWVVGDRKVTRNALGHAKLGNGGEEAFT